MLELFDSLDRRRFNERIGNWDVSRVKDIMGQMFRGAAAFNQPIDNWDVSGVTDIMSQMFESARAFNQPIGNWDVSSVTSRSWMFRFADAFDQNLCTWGNHVPSTVIVLFMLDSTSCSNEADPDVPSGGSFCYSC